MKTRKCCPPPPHNIFLFESNLNVKFSFLRLLQFLSDLSYFGYDHGHEMYKVRLKLIPRRYLEKGRYFIKQQKHSMLFIYHRTFCFKLKHLLLYVYMFSQADKRADRVLLSIYLQLMIQFISLHNMYYINFILVILIEII